VLLNNFFSAAFNSNVALNELAYSVALAQHFRILLVGLAVYVLIA
jgi:hypothetical protein